MTTIPTGVTLYLAGQESGPHVFHIRVEESSGSMATLRGEDVFQPWLRACCSCGWQEHDAHRTTIEENSHYRWLAHVSIQDVDEEQGGERASGGSVWRWVGLPGQYDPEALIVLDSVSASMQVNARIVRKGNQKSLISIGAADLFAAIEHGWLVPGSITGDEAHPLCTCHPVAGRATCDVHRAAAAPDLAATVERLTEERDRARAGLLHYWERETCPCGARIEDPAGFPHVIDCPVGQALR